MLTKLLRPLGISLLCLFLPSLAFAISLQVNLVGIDSKLADSIRADLHLNQAIKEPKLTEARIQNLYDLADEQIIATLQAKGYYDSEITPSLTNQNDVWKAKFIIKPGKPTVLAAVTVKVEGPGKKDPRVTAILTTPNLIVDKVISHEAYENTKEKLIADFNALGYLQASFAESVMEVNREKFYANVKITIDTGILYVFGKIHYIESVYPASLLNRYLPFHPGQPYELDKLIKFHENLEQADLFNKIRFDPMTNFANPKDNVVPINVRLTPKPRNLYTGSIGYGNDTGGIRGSLGWLHRRVAAPGHKLFAYVSASSFLRLAKLNYIIPGKQAATDNYTLGADVQEETVDELYSMKGEVYANKTIKRGNLESIYGINLFTETFHITKNVPNQNKQYLLPNAKWIWIDSYEKDNYDFGSKYDLTLRGGIKPILSSTSVIQMEASGKKIIPLIDKTRFLFRANIGFVFSKDFNSLPPSLRFFTGGDDSIRGFNYNSIGPRVVPGNPCTDNNGGKYLYVASGEIERRLYENLSGVVFFDAGNVSMGLTGPLAMGTGFGLRYKLPIGNFRLDFAKPLNTVLDKSWLIHFNFGADF